jgi:uncharacterized membrane protein YkoI
VFYFFLCKRKLNKTEKKETNYSLRKVIPMESARREAEREVGHKFQKIELPSNETN